MLRHRISSVLATLFGLAAIGAAQGYQIPETAIVPVAPIPGFPPQPAVIYPGAHTSGFSIAPGQVQQFQLFAQKDQVLHFRLRVQTNNLDPVVNVLDSFAQQQFQVSCVSSTYATCALSHTWVVPATDTYTINLSDDDGFNGGGYVLQVDLEPPMEPMIGLRHQEAYDEQLSPVTDTDWIRFEAQAGTILEIKGQVLSNNLDPTLEVWDPAGNVVATGGCNASTYATCTFSIPLDLTVPGSLSGTYSLRIRENGIDNTGSLRLTLNCLFGACSYSSKGLTRDNGSLSLANGGTSAFALDAGLGHAGATYLLVGSTSGYLPGFDVLGVHLPLAIPDAYFDLTVARPNQPPLSGSFGILDGIGRTAASFDVPAGSPPGLAGLEVAHAFLVLDYGAPTLAIPFVSNPVVIELVP